MSPGPARHYVFTFNNPGAVVPRGPNDLVRYVCWQPERGEYGTEHLQGYAEFRRPVRIPQAQAALGLPPDAHFEKRKGSRDDARDYTRKPETRIGPWQEFGDWDTSQGKRNDLDAVSEAIKRGDSLRTIVTDYTPQFIKYHHGIERALGVLAPAPPRAKAPLVFILHGPTGTGKSRTCQELDPTAYWFPRPQNAGCYAMGYCGQSTVVFDDFYSWIPYDLLLRLCDRYPLNVNVMGGSAAWHADVILFTSNQDPDKWYPNIRDKAAFKRRVSGTINLQSMEQRTFTYAALEKAITEHRRVEYNP